MKDLITRALDN